MLFVLPPPEKKTLGSELVWQESHDKSRLVGSSSASVLFVKLLIVLIDLL